MTPGFLDLDQIFRLHQDLIERYGGEHGLRDQGLLESALAQPRATFAGEFLHKDVFEMAAAYLYHIVQNHPFLDGNKRTGAAAAIIFLFMNDINIVADQEGLVELTLSVAQGHTNKTQIADFFRQRVP